LKIDDVSLATFCAVLMFIYSGNLKLTFGPNRFAISKSHASFVAHDTDEQPQDIPRWHPLDLDSP